MLVPSEACYALIRRFETLRLEAYADPGPSGIPTIGYGHTVGVRMGDTCTVEQAEQWLREDVSNSATIVTNNFPDVTQPQYDALVDFCYNVGPGWPGYKDGLIWLKSGDHSTLMLKTLAGDIAGAGEEFLKWNKAGGEILRGLTTRRGAERFLFESVPS